MWKDYAPYIVPLLVVALIVRRSARARKVRLRGMWISPVILTLMTAGALIAEPMPGLLAIGGFVVATLAGAGVGYLMARHLHLSIDAGTGEISSRATMIGTLLILGLFAARFGLKLVFPGLADHAHANAEVTEAANGLLIFTVATLIARTATIWNRTRPLLAAHAARAAEPAIAPPE